MPDEKLSAEQLTRIYEQRIRPDFFAGIVRQAQPTAVFVGGQPGAGKTSVVERVQARFNNQAVQLDTDRLRSYDPRYRRLERTDPTRAIEVSSPSAAAWTIMLRNEAIERGANLIYETAMRNAPAFEQVTAKLAQTHRLELEIVATRPEVATARAINRREQEIVRQGSGRLVAPDVIQSAERGMLDILRQAEAKGQIARITICDQFGKSLYDASAPYHPEGQAAVAVERDRLRPLSAAENQTLREVWSDTFDKMAVRGIDSQELCEIAEYGPLPATVRDSIATGSLAQSAVSRALADQLLADSERTPAVRVATRERCSNVAPSHPVKTAPTFPLNDTSKRVEYIKDMPRKHLENSYLLSLMRAERQRDAIASQFMADEPLLKAYMVRAQKLASKIGSSTDSESEIKAGALALFLSERRSNAVTVHKPGGSQGQGTGEQRSSSSRIRA